MRRCDKSVRCSSIGYGVRKRHRVTPNDSVAATANDNTENTAVDLEELEVKANTVVMDGKRTTLIPTTVRQEIRIRRHRISAGYSTPSVYHSSVSDQRYPSYYYLNGTWAWNGLYIGLSFRSPFRKSLVCYTSGMDAGDYINNETYYNTTYRPEHRADSNLFLRLWQENIER